MNNINALIERLFDWRSTASRREFLNIFLAICGVGLLLSIPYIYLIAEFIGLVVDYGEDAAGMMFESMLTAKIVLGLCLWTCFFFFYVLTTLLIVVTTSVRRLNDIKGAKGWVILNFFPPINLLLWTYLALAPHRPCKS